MTDATLPTSGFVAKANAKMPRGILAENRRRLWLAFLSMLGFLALFWLLSNWDPVPLFFWSDTRVPAKTRDVVNAITLGAALSMFCLVCLMVLRCNSVLRQARPFFLDRVADWYVSSEPHYADPRQLLNNLAEKATKLSDARRLPGFARRRFYAIGVGLKAAALDPDSGLRILDAALAPSDSADFELRPVAQLLATGLLFTGIVGTLYGLVGVLSPETIRAVLRSTTDAQAMEYAVSNLAANFGVAFGASLVAYIAYLFARFLLDIADQAHDALVVFLDRDVLTGCRVVLAPLQIEVRVDLPQRTRDLLDHQAKGLHAIAASEEAQVAELRKLASRIARTASLFNRATQKATVAARVIGEGLQKGRDEWQQASTVWRDTTSHFTTDATALTSALTQHVTSLEGTRAAFDRSVADVDVGVRRMTEIWRDHVSQMMQGLADGVNSYRAVILESGAELSGLLKAFNETREMVKESAKTVGQGQRALEAAIMRVEQQYQSASDRLVAVLDSRAQSLEQSIITATAHIEPFGVQLIQMVRAASDLRAAMLGDGQVDDLLVVLRRLDQLLQKRGEAFQ